jgi:hypothetical protein
MRLPEGFVKKLGREKTRKLVFPTTSRKPQAKTEVSDEERINRFLQKSNYEPFTLIMCSKKCVIKKDIVLKILQDRGDIEISPGGICYQKIYHINAKNDKEKRSELGGITSDIE